MSASTLRFTLDELLAATGGRLVRGSTLGRVLEGVTTDSRRISRGSAFFGVRGETFDGSDFAGAAAQSGAFAVIISDEKAESARNVSGPAIIAVESTTRALESFAGWHRRRMTTRVVAVTGSNGKTTTKEMVASILRESGPTLATDGNLNNEVGAPLTLLQLTPGHRFAVIELGMNHEGEIGRLTAMAAPDVGVVTMAAAVHTEGLGGIEGVARAKGELYHGLPLISVAVANSDDLRMRERAVRAGRRTIWFGRGGADVRLGRIVSHDRQGIAFRADILGNERTIRIPVVGEHNALNACAAMASALALDIPEEAIFAGLERVKLPGRRLRLSPIAGVDATLLDDCYNANPSSMLAAISALAALAPAGHRIAVLGDMRELGVEEESGHRAVGLAAANAGLKLLVAFGPVSAHIAAGAIAAGLSPDRILHTADPHEAAARVRSILSSNDLVLVKASRGTQLERVSDLLAPQPKGEVH